MRAIAIAAAAVVGASVVAGCSSSAPAAAGGTSSATATPAAGPDAPEATQSTAAQSVGTVALSASQCSGSDHGLATERAAWSTLMRAGSQFADWESATSSYLSLARGDAGIDAGFSGADAQDAVDAQALSAVLAQLDADLQQGVSTGSAPSSYKADAGAVKTAAALFASC